MPKRVLSYICLCVPVRPCAAVGGGNTGNIKHLSNQNDNRELNMQTHVSDSFFREHVHEFASSTSETWLTAAYAMTLPFHPSNWG